MERLTEEERKALRGSKFAPLPSAPTTSRSHARLAHPGGALATNKAAALAKFLERKLQEPDGLASLNPDLIELAVKNAKETVNASGTSKSGRIIRHVDSFGDSEDSSEEHKVKISEPQKPKKKQKKKNKKNKTQEAVEDPNAPARRPKKKVKH